MPGLGRGRPAPRTTKSVISGFCMLLWIITAHKRSLGEGNVFNRICHSVEGGAGGLYDVTSSVSGPTFLPGVLCPGGLCQADPRIEAPQYGDERAVCILLKCFLVLRYKYCNRILDLLSSLNLSCKSNTAVHAMHTARTLNKKPCLHVRTVCASVATKCLHQ